MKKLKRALLIDDSKATNFFNKTIIEKTECIEEVIVAEDGKAALEQIQSEIVPEFIFLDINMPIMNGWEFISEYQKLDDKYKGSIIILMLGADLNQEEKKQIENISEIKEFEKKMLSKEVVCRLTAKYFNIANSTACA